MNTFLIRLKEVLGCARTRFGSATIPGKYAFLALGIAVAFFVQLYNSYGLATGSEEGNTRLLQSIMAPLLRSGNPAPRDAISVVVYDQASFDALGIDVPILPYDRQAALLRRVAALRPVAIFIDANYKRDLSDPAGVSNLHAAIEDVRSGQAGAPSIPVYIGEVKTARPVAVAASDEAFFGPTVKSDADRAREVFNDFRNYAKAQNFETGTVRVVDHTLDYPARTDRLFTDPKLEALKRARKGFLDSGNKDAAKKLDEQIQIDTPAFRLYHDICTWQAAGGDGSISTAKLKCDDLKDPPSMALQWLSYDAAAGGNPECQRSALKTYAADVVRNLFRKTARAADFVYNPCVYLRTITLNTVLGAPDINSLRGDFTGKVVLIGSALGDDTFVAPGQGKVPGIFLHAMALENLLALGRNYHRWPPEIEMLGGSVNIDFFLELGLALIANLAARKVEQRFAENKQEADEDADKSPSRRSQLRVYFCVALGLSLVFGTMAMLITYVWFHWTPVNALSITLATLAVAGLEKYHELFLVARKWSPAAIVSVLITAGLVSWLAVSLFITDDVLDVAKTHHNHIWWSEAVLLAWTGLLIYGYRKACAGVVRMVTSYLRRG